MNTLSRTAFTSQISHQYPYYNITGKDNYITINGLKYIIGGTSSMTDYDFKLNKHGGDLSWVEFAYNETAANINDEVVLAFYGEPVYRGYISALELNGAKLIISPLWAKLEHYIIFDTDYVDEITDTVFNIINTYLRPFIERAGITYISSDINVPNQVITISLNGISIEDTLDEIEKILPEDYVWGVDINGGFYYKRYDSSTEHRFTFINGDFSDSKIVTDYSEVVSEMVVSVKQNIIALIDNPDYNPDHPDIYPPYIEEVTSTEQLPIGIVGTNVPQLLDKYESGKLYPATYLTSVLGNKSSRYDVPFVMDYETAMDSAYSFLQRQKPTTTCTLKNVNLLNHIPKILEDVDVYAFPTNGNTGIVDLTVSAATELIYEYGVGNISDIGNELSSSYNTSSDPNVLILSLDDNWQRTCDLTERLEYITIEYSSRNNITTFLVTDDYTDVPLTTQATGGILRIVLDNKFDKRTLLITMVDEHAGDPELEDSTFTYKRVIGQFSRGVEFFNGKIREVNYKYTDGIISTDIVVAEINAVLTGYTKRMIENMSMVNKIIQG